MDIATKLSDLRADLSECRRAITYRGGEISATAGFKEVADKIASLPASSSIGTVIDEDMSLLKIVPIDTTGYGYLKSIGGMTYKCNQLIPFPYATNGKTINGITFTVQEDGTVIANGTATGRADLGITLRTQFTLPKGIYYISGAPNGASANTYYIVSSFFKGSTWLADMSDYSGKGSTYNSTNLDYDGVSITISIKAGVECNNLVFKPMINVGSTALPYEPYYEGLRDNKPTAIKVHGANLIPFPYTIGGVGATKVNGGITFTVNADRSFTVKGTAQGTPSFAFATNLNLPTDANYYLSANHIGGEWVSGVSVYAVADGAYESTTNARPTVTISAGKKFTFVSISITNGTTVDATFKPMLSRAQALPYTDYIEPITYEIPEALQGTGKGVVGASDTIDFENDKQITKTHTVIFDGTENWKYLINWGSVTMKSPSFLPKKGKGNHQIITNAPMTCVFADSNCDRLRFGDIDYSNDPIENYGITSVEDWTNYLKARYAAGDPVMVTYEIAEPTETDIDTSAFNHLIKVEGGGAIEIITDNGGKVPTTIIYQTIV